MVVPGNTTVTGGYFYPITPCRLIDTRFARPSVAAGATRTVLAWNACGIPATATALAANVTSVNIPGNGYLRAYPAGLSSPPLAWVNAFRYNQPTATQAFISINGPTPGSFTLFGDFASGAVDAIVDVDGYVGAQSVSTPDTYTLNLRDPQNRLATKYSLVNGVSAIVADYVYVGNQLVAKCPPSGGCSFFVTDHLGTPRLQTDTNATTVTKMKTRAFGLNLTGTLPDASDFASMEKDASSGNHYDHARYYMSWVARFHSPDQLGGHPEDPQSWNRYAYARNNPLRFLDLNGLEPLDAGVRVFLEHFYHADLSRVQVHNGFFSRLVTGLFGASAVTFGKHILFGNSAFREYQARSIPGLGVTGHEVKHTLQYAERGGVGFLTTYLSQWVGAGFSYRGIGLENEAFDAQGLIENLLENNRDILDTIQQGGRLNGDQLNRLNGLSRDASPTEQEDARERNDQAARVMKVCNAFDDCHFEIR